MKVDVDEAKATLPSLLDRVENGESVTVTRAGRPVAQLVPVVRQASRQLGQDRGVYVVPDDFGEPLPDEVAAAFPS